MHHLTLLELNELISEALQSHLEPTYWVIAEIGEMRINQKGHCYMEMVEKDDDEIRAKMRATIWSFTFRNINAWFTKISGQHLQPGLKILFNASAQFHPIYGLSLNIKDIDAQFTLGERARKKQEVLQKLAEDGVLDMNKETTLPLVPQSIAIISSPTAAGYGDFINHIENNSHKYKLKYDLFTALMQGDTAASSIVQAIHEVYADVDKFDLLVIIRGGGATVDLDCFDNYELASHISQFPLPVITGIGHERDQTVADIVAHTSLKTPTAVAEFILAGIKAFEEKLNDLARSMKTKANEIIGQQLMIMDRHAHDLEMATARRLHEHMNRISALEQHLHFLSRSAVEQQLTYLNAISNKITTLPWKILEKQQKKIEHMEKTVEYLDPQKILDRGYTISIIDNTIIKNLDYPEENKVMVTKASNQTVFSRITTKHKK